MVCSPTLTHDAHSQRLVRLGSHEQLYAGLKNKEYAGVFKVLGLGAFVAEYVATFICNVYCVFVNLQDAMELCKAKRNSNSVTNSFRQGAVLNTLAYARLRQFALKKLGIIDNKSFLFLSVSYEEFWQCSQVNDANIQNSDNFCDNQPCLIVR